MKKALWFAAVSVILAVGAASAQDQALLNPRQAIRLVYNPNTLPPYAKARHEIFADVLSREGIDVKWVDVQGSHAPAIAAVIGGSADVTFGGTTAVALTSAANGQAVEIAALGRSVKSIGGILVFPGSGINTVADLRGRTVAVNRGGFGELTLVAALEKNHIPRDQVKFVYLSLDDGATAFAARQVDAYVGLATSYRIETVIYGAKPIFDIDKDMTPEESDIAGNTLSFVVTRKYAEAHKDVLSRVFEAYKNVAVWVTENPDAAFAISNAVNHFPAKIQDSLRSDERGYQLEFPTTAAQIAELQKSADFLYANQVLPRKIDVRNYVVKY